MYRRTLLTTGLVLALSALTVSPSLAASAPTASGSPAPAAEQCRTIDFTEASVKLIPPPGTRPITQRRLTVSGTKPSSTMRVKLSRLGHVTQPDYWVIRVVGCSTEPSDPAPTGYAVTYDFSWTMGTCGIEVLGATTSKKFDLAGCTPAPLPGTRWVLDTSSLGVPVPAGLTVSAAFSETTINGSTGCNSFSAQYTLGEDGAFDLGPIAMTRMMCAPEINAVETAFVRRLEAVTRLMATPDELRLLGDGQVLLRFVPGVKPV